MNKDIYTIIKDLIESVKILIKRVERLEEKIQGPTRLDGSE